MCFPVFWRWAGLVFMLPVRVARGFPPIVRFIPFSYRFMPWMTWLWSLRNRHTYGRPHEGRSFLFDLRSIGHSKFREIARSSFLLPISLICEYAMLILAITQARLCRHLVMSTCFHVPRGCRDKRVRLYEGFRLLRTGLSIKYVRKGERVFDLRTGRGGSKYTLGQRFRPTLTNV